MTILNKVQIQFTKVSLHGTKHISTEVFTSDEYQILVNQLTKSMREGNIKSRDVINKLNSLLYGQ